jgi:endonuclease YncB( thermonuclease family)
VYRKLKKVISMIQRRVRKWDDGDSGIFSNGRRFRLARVRAPEKYQFGGERTTRRAAGMTGQTNGRVSWRRIDVDRYGRELGEMTNRDGSINERLIRRGARNKGR